MNINSDEILPADVIDSIRANRKIDAIKALREQRDLGLKEAKHAVDAYIRSNPQIKKLPSYQTNSNAGNTIFFCVVMALAFAAYYYFK